MKDYVLVTGGAGFIGSSLCKQLLHEGNSIVIIDNFNDYYEPEIKHSNVEELHKISWQNNAFLDVICGDIRDPLILESVFLKYNFVKVIHLAAYAGVRPSLENPLLYADVNVTGTINLLENCRKFNVKDFIFASSSSVYGNNQVPFNEKQLISKPQSMYAATKITGEIMCKLYHDIYNLNIVCLRFFTVYGPKQRPDLAIRKFVEKIDNNVEIELFGNGLSARDYTYIDDIISGIMKATEWIDKQESCFEIFNLGNSTQVTLSQLISCIENSMEKKASIKNIEDQLGDVKETYADICKSKEILNYNPSTKIVEGIEKFINWYYVEKGEDNNEK